MSQRANIGLYFACLALVLLPVLLTQHPPLLDYPNHLARLFILTHPDDPYLAQFYRIDWSLVPNLGFDLIGYALASLMPVDLAGRVFIGIAIAVTLSAPMALHKALYGRLSPLPLFAGAIVFNRVLQDGFLAYYLGAGLAVWAFAIHLGLRRRRPAARFSFLQAAALVVYVVHLYAVAVLAVLVLTYATAQGWRVAGGGMTARLGTALRTAMPQCIPFLVPFVLLLASRTAGSADLIEYWPSWPKVIAIPWSLTTTNTATSLGLAAMVLLPPVIARLSGGRALHPAMTWPVGTLLVLYFLLPNVLLSSANADWRVIIPLALLLAGSAEDASRRSWAKAAVAGVALALNAMVTSHVVSSWRAGDHFAAELDLVLAKVPAGAMLIPYMPGEQYSLSYLDPPLVHLPTRAVITRRAIVPTVFANHGQQPILLREPLKRACDWFLWLHIGGPVPSGIERIVLPSTYILETRTRRATDDRFHPLPLEGDAVAETEHFVLYRLRGEQRPESLALHVANRPPENAPILCGDVLTRR